MSIKEKIKESVELSLTKAREIYKMDFPTPLISFNLRGSCAGQAWANAYVDGKYVDFYMKFNIQIAEAHMGEFMVNTVPHEVAHIVSYCLYGTNGKGHGREWQTIMRSFGLEPTRCHNYDMSKVSYYMERRNIF
jgi:SprT protein